MQMLTASSWPPEKRKKKKYQWATEDWNEVVRTCYFWILENLVLPTLHNKIKDFKIWEWADATGIQLRWLYFLEILMEKKKNTTGFFVVVFLVLLDAMRGNTTFCWMWMWERPSKVRSVVRLSCLCVTSDEDGDKVASLWEAAVSSS